MRAEDDTRRSTGPFAEPGAHPRDLRPRFDDWWRSAAMADLARHFGGPDPRTARLDELCRFASSNWDFRRTDDGPTRERNDMDDAFADDPSSIDAVLAAAEGLGMMSGGRRRHPRYDVVLVLGGRAMACLTRSRMASKILEQGIEATEVVGLTASRDLDAAERALLADRDLPRPATETEAMVAAIDAVFAVRDHATRPRVRVVETPSIGAHRASTAESMTHWAAGAALGPEHVVLVVTGAIFVPYQGIEALRTLAVPHRCGIDVVGLRPRTPLAERRPLGLSATLYLQEVNATLQAGARLVEAIEAT